MAISDSGSKFWDSGSPPIESGHAQGYFFFLENGNLGFWKPSEPYAETDFVVLQISAGTDQENQAEKLYFAAAHMQI